MNVLKLETSLKSDLWSHLLPPGSDREQAAFLFCSASGAVDGVEFEVLDSIFLEAADFAAQYSDYLELSDATRIALIKRAHELGASLAEVHSHPGPWPAAFSPADRRGLSETVPHMRWRLKRRWRWGRCQSKAKTSTSPSVPKVML